ncbi:MAG: hypothetical protein WBB95_06195, partial [Pseudomonas sp.]
MGEDIEASLGQKNVGAAVRRFDLLAKAVCQSTNSLADPPHSRASPLPQLNLISSGKSCAALLLPCFCFNHSGRLSGRRA